MMMYSAGSSDSYLHICDVMSVCMLNGKASESSCIHKLSA